MKIQLFNENVKVQLLDENAKIPVRATEFSAGCDLYAVNSAIIPPHTTSKIHTGIAIKIPDGCFGGIYARSGIASKRYLRPANCTGVIDSDYTGEVIVMLHNDSNEPQEIEAGERVAQLIIQPYFVIEMDVVDKLDETDRGSGGFGSTGKM